MHSTNVRKFYVEGSMLLETELPRGVKYKNLRRLTVNASGKFVSLQIEVPDNGLRNDGTSALVKGWYLSDSELIRKNEQYTLFDGKQKIGLFTVETLGPSLEPAPSV